jgi:hypothetical protein
MRGGWAASALAVVRRPSLWGVALRQARVLARPGWWRRAPLLTAYGDEARPPDPHDLVAYLHWCREYGSLVRA